jgi:hypothetical protein
VQAMPNGIYTRFVSYAINVVMVKTISLLKKQQYVRKKVSFNLFNHYIPALKEKIKPDLYFEL